MALPTLSSVSTKTPGNIDMARLHDAFDTLGSTPRICIDIACHPETLEEYEEEVKKAISNITSDLLKKLTADSASLSMDSISYKICLVSRKNPDKVRSGTMVAPITPHIQSRLANQFRNMGWAEQLCLYNFFAKVPESRKMAGVFYEALAQQHFQERISLSIVPMVKLGRRKPTQKSTMPQWYTSHVLLTNPRLEALRQNALHHVISINIVPSRTEEFTDNGPSHIEQDVLYIPEATNHESLNSFIWHGDHLYFFQFTISEEHDGFKPRVFPFFNRFPNIPQVSNWQFVLIIEPNLILKSPQPWALDLRGVPLFSAVVDVCQQQ